MNELSIIRKNGVDVIDSREVAEAIGKQHAHLMRDIHNFVDILEKASGRKSALSENSGDSNESDFGLVEKSTESNFGLSEKSNERKLALVGKNDAGKFSSVDFFIPHTYTDSKGEQRPCYLLTKKGCDMVANKMTGEKGVLFTAAYVTAFEKMRKNLTRVLPQDYPSALRALADAEEQKLKLLAENQTMQPKADYFDALVDRNLLTNFRDTAKELGVKQTHLIAFLLENGYVYRDQRGKLQPYAEKNKGLFEVKEFVSGRSGFSDTQTLITPKGRETFRLLLRRSTPLSTAGKESLI